MIGSTKTAFFHHPKMILRAAGKLAKRIETTLRYKYDQKHDRPMGGDVNKYFKQLFRAFIVLGIAWASGAPAEDIVRTFDARPKFEKSRVELKKLYSIDATRFQVLNREPWAMIASKIDFDSHNRLYIMDSWAAAISVFDEDGRYLRSFGRKGQGPGEFYNPSMLFIKNDRIHVPQSFGLEFKIVDLEGRFLSIQRIPKHLENLFRFFVEGDDLYVFSGKLDSSFTHLDFVLRRFEGGRWEREKILLTSPYSPGFNMGKGFVEIVFPAVLKDGRIVFPEDAARRYSLIEYDPTGAHRQAFGRTYQVHPFSEKARGQLDELYKGQIKQGMKIPASPAAIRNIFRDHRNNIWVVVGETGEDTDDPEFENTVDVFGPDGGWLYAFKTKFVSRNSICHDGKIFTLRPSDPVSESQTIDVVAIRY